MKLLLTIILLFPLLVFSQAPSNDDCTGSITIFEFGCWGGSSTGASDDVNSCSGCQTPNCGQWDEVWFDITPTTTSLTYSLTGGSNFSEMSIVLFSAPGSGCPSNSNVLQSGCGAPTVSGSFTGLSPGTTYYIAISGPDNEQDTFNLCFGTVLPIELIEFDGYSDDRVNILYWTTASEINNDYFRLERSEDGIHWETLTEVKGVGNSSIKTNYKFIDEDPYVMTTYYRLSQVDFDGKDEMFDTIAVENESGVFYIYSKSEDNNIYLSSPYYFELYNMMGQVVVSGSGDVVNTLGLPQGIYVLKIEGGYTQKFFVR
jgi:hypothetical protein